MRKIEFTTKTNPYYLRLINEDTWDKEAFDKRLLDLTKDPEVNYVIVSNPEARPALSL